MNTHDRSWRLTHGLQWRRERPTIFELSAMAKDWLTGIALVAALLVMYGIVGRIDYETTRAAEAEFSGLAPSKAAQAHGVDAEPAAPAKTKGKKAAAAKAKAKADPAPAAPANEPAAPVNTESTFRPAWPFPTSAGV